MLHTINDEGDHEATGLRAKAQSHPAAARALNTASQSAAKHSGDRLLQTRISENIRTSQAPQKVRSVICLDSRTIQ